MLPDAIQSGAAIYMQVAAPLVLRAEWSALLF